MLEWVSPEVTEMVLSSVALFEVKGLVVLSEVTEMLWERVPSEATEMGLLLE
jgi:hypothetical protein